MAIEPEFVRLMKRWVRPTKSQEEMQATNTASSSIKPIQLDDDENDLR